MKEIDKVSHIVEEVLGFLMEKKLFNVSIDVKKIDSSWHISFMTNSISKDLERKIVEELQADQREITFEDYGYQYVDHQDLHIISRLVDDVIVDNDINNNKSIIRLIRHVK